MLGGSAGRATGREGAVKGRGVAAAAGGVAALRAVLRRAAGFLAVERLAVVFFPVDPLAVVRLVVLRFVVLRFAVDFLPPARFAVLRLAVDFFAFFFAAISPPFGCAPRGAFGWWFMRMRTRYLPAIYSIGLHQKQALIAPLWLFRENDRP
jgi:hypothetical protein